MPGRGCSFLNQLALQFLPNFLAKSIGYKFLWTSDCVCVQSKLNKLGHEAFPDIKIIDDTLLGGGGGHIKEKVDQNHDTKLRQLLDMCQQQNMNSHEVNIRRTEVPCLGQLLIVEGFCPEKCPEKGV